VSRKRNIAIIGGGPAGLMAAGQAAVAGAKVTVYERMERPCRKLRITGKGRCNLTNNAEKSEFIKRFGKNGRFLYQAFSEFFSDDLISFFNRLGVKTELERGGRYFPSGNRAEDIVDALVRWVKKGKVRIVTGSRINCLTVEKKRVIGIQQKNIFFAADKVIIATGGKSYPATGSSGDGYHLAETVGHTIIPARPALVPIVTAGDTALRLQGLALKNIQVRVLIDGKKAATTFGEMLFTHYGLSGPIILTLSGIIVDALEAKKKVALLIDLKPALDDRKLDNRLLRDFNEYKNKSFGNILPGLLPQKMIPVCIDQTGIPHELKGNSITAENRKKLRLWLKELRFEVTGHRGFSEAIVTAGGVNLKEINPKTLESKLIKDLYFAGEILDLDGETGGYNLQAAFSTGFLAGRSASS